MQNLGQRHRFLARWFKNCLISLGLAWLTGAGTVWVFIRHHQKIPNVSYADLVFPHRWDAYRQARGNHYITQAELQLKNGDATYAFHLLRAGINLAPNHPRGRVLLASLYLWAKQPDLAEKLLLDGLALQTHNLAYLRTVLSLLDELQKDDLLLEVAQQALRFPEKLPPTGDALLALAGAQAAYQRSNHAAAQTLLARPSVKDSPAATCLLAQIDWADGWPELALLRLQAHQQSHPPDPAVQQLHNQYLRALGRWSEWRSHLVAARVGHPDEPGARLDLLHHYQEAHDFARLETEFAAARDQFGHDPATLLQLADFAAHAGRPDLLARLPLPASTSHEQQIARRLLLAEAHLGAQHYREALSHLEIKDPALRGPLVATQTGLRAVAHHALGQADEARLQINHLLAQENLRPEPLVALAARLRSLGADEFAEALLARALDLAPLQQPALLALINLELDQATLAQHPEHLTALLRSRRPPRDILQRINDQLGSDRYLLVPEQVAMLTSLRPALANTKSPTGLN